MSPNSSKGRVGIPDDEFAANAIVETASERPSAAFLNLRIMCALIRVGGFAA